jgi:hypothetical protein
MRVVEVIPHAFLSSALYEGDWSASNYDRINLLCTQLGGPQNRPGCVEKRVQKPQSGNELRNVTLLTKLPRPHQSGSH